MKVVQVAHYYGPLGGIERVVYQFCQGLKGLYSVEALACNTSIKTVRTEEEGIPVTRVGRIAHFQRMSVSPSFPLHLRRMKPDLVHVHMTNPLAEVSCLFSGLKCPVIATYHMDVTRQRVLNSLYAPLQRMFLERTRLITVSSANFARTSPVLSNWMEKVRVLPFGISQKASLPTERTSEMLKKLRESFPGKVVLFVGRLIHYKGIEVLVDAMRSVQATCLIIGGGYLEQEIKKQIQLHHLENKIFLVGRVSDEELIAYYQRADVFVLPSVNRTEAYGLTQIEAMAQGTPVICTDVGTGTSFVNEDGVSGLVIQPGDSSALADALNHILRDEELRSKLSAGARHRAETLFTEEYMVMNLRNIYKEILR